MTQFAALKKPVGRFDGDTRGVHVPASRAAAPFNARVAVGSVQDPYDRTGRISVTIRLSDVLETEYKHQRISEAAYRIGRDLQATFERASSLRTTFRAEPSASRDATQANEKAIVHNIDAAHAVLATKQRIERSVGTIGLRLLVAVLADGKTFKELAAQRDRLSERAVGQVADRFRFLMEGLAEDWAIQGKAKQPIVAVTGDGPVRREGRGA